ncbi:Xaa-Pro peptidase family protein [Ferrimonas balearica]|nr:Xaa-Pro peptidase family protein [Ferrimonas balearica]
MPAAAPLPVAEYQSRTARAQQAMAAQGIAALLLTSEPDVRYFTGFLTRFWESPTRPWFLVLPATGAPVAVIPAIGAELMGQSWITDIRSWDAPDYADDGVGLLAETLVDLVPPGGRIGVPMGRESVLRMPLADWERLTLILSDRPRVDASPLLRDLQMVKSEAEIALIRRICDIGGRAFSRVPEVARPGVTLAQLFRRFQGLLLEEGADWVSYLAGGAAQGGYGDVISPAHDRPLTPGDLVMLDTGAVRHGYFCDFDRNWSVGPASEELRAAHRILWEATERAAEAARPGARACDLHAAMLPLLARHNAGPVTGRLGHGLGMRLTEPPSLIPADETELRAGMVLTLEPSLVLGPGRMMVQEENIVIREDRVEWLTPRAPQDLPELEWDP